MVKNLFKGISWAKSLDKLRCQFLWQFNHRHFLLKMLLKNSICVEIGVHKGDFSAQILQTLNPKELHLVDPWKHEESDMYKEAWQGGKTLGGQHEMDGRYETVCLRFASEIRSGHVIIHRNYSSIVLNTFPDGYFDWVYIDGNHYYEYVKKDLEISFNKTKPGGYVTGDDYVDGGWWQGGIKRAVDEFVREKPVKVVQIKNYQFILQK
jgi:hypothetical protein